MSEPEPIEDPAYSVKTKLTKAQLEGIGTVAAAYNDVEIYVDVILATVLFLGEEAVEVTSRINGIEGKIEIIKAKMRRQNIPNDWYNSICLSLSGFFGLKKERDKIIHARALKDDPISAVTFAKRGKYYRTLLSEPFLEGIYTRLVHSKYEMVSIFEMATQFTTLEKVKFYGDLLIRTSANQEAIKIANQLREQTLQLAQSTAPTSMSRLLERQKRRLALPPLPELPQADED